MVAARRRAKGNRVVGSGGSGRLVTDAEGRGTPGAKLGHSTRRSVFRTASRHSSPCCRARCERAPRSEAAIRRALRARPLLRCQSLLLRQCNCSDCYVWCVCGGKTRSGSCRAGFRLLQAHTDPERSPEMPWLSKLRWRQQAPVAVWSSTVSRGDAVARGARGKTLAEHRSSAPPTALKSLISSFPGAGIHDARCCRNYDDKKKQFLRAFSVSPRLRVRLLNGNSRRSVSRLTHGCATNVISAATGRSISQPRTEPVCQRTAIRPPRRHKANENARGEHHADVDPFK